MSGKTLINIHAALRSSRVNGPGNRMVVFFQGCALRCPGCFNPLTHPVEAKTLMTPDEIFGAYYDGSVEGMTVSGGEPFLQPEGLTELLQGARKRGLSTVVYTGSTVEGLLKKPGAPQALDFIDVLIDGPFDAGRPEKTSLARGSTNQRFLFLTGRYLDADMHMPGRVEVSIDKDGLVTGTGFGVIAPFGGIALA